MNVSLPEALKDFVEDQVSARGYSTSSEYVRELIRKDQDGNGGAKLVHGSGGIVSLRAEQNSAT